MGPKSVIWTPFFLAASLVMYVGCLSLIISEQQVLASLLDQDTLTDRGNLGGMLLSNETNNGEQTSQITDQQIQQQDFAKNITKSDTTTENEAQIDKNLNSTDLTSLLTTQPEQNTGSGFPIPCPPFCKSLPSPSIQCPPFCAQPDTSEKVSSNYADVIYRDGPIITNNNTGRSDKIATSACYPGELLVGGGWKSKDTDVRVQSSFGQKNEWFVQFHGPVDLQAFALCLKFNGR